MHLFYAPDIAGDTYTFSEEESKHCIKVLRLVEGQEVMLSNGIGTMFKAKILEAHPKRTVLQIIEATENFGKRSYHLHIAIAPTKNNERMETFLEKATEIGIDEISPLLCKHSERKVINAERYTKIITSAVKQSIKAYHPKLNDLTNFSNFVKNASADLKLIAHCANSTRKELHQLVEFHEKILILIGPEGDFSQEEIAEAERFGFVSISMGSARLRTETAGIVACNSVGLLKELLNKK